MFSAVFPLPASGRDRGVREDDQGPDVDVEPGHKRATVTVTVTVTNTSTSEGKDRADQALGSQPVGFASERNRCFYQIIRAVLSSSSPAPLLVLVLVLPLVPEYPIFFDIDIDIDIVRL